MVTDVGLERQKGAAHRAMAANALLQVYTIIWSIPMSVFGTSRTLELIIPEK